MRLGILILPDQPWRVARTESIAAAECGAHILFSAEHLAHPRSLAGWWADGWATVAAASQVVPGADLGLLVASAAIHPPAWPARAAATVADLAGGRFVLGLGAGAPFDAAAVRGRPEPTGVLAGRFGEVVPAGPRVPGRRGGVARRACRGAGPVPPPAVPDGAPPPPLMIAAHGPRALRVAATYRDAWNTYGGPGLADADADEEQVWRAVREQSERFTAECARAGRDPAALRRSLLLGNGRVQPTSSAEAFADALGRAAGLGFDEFVVYWRRAGAAPEGFADLAAAAHAH